MSKTFAELKQLWIDAGGAETDGVIAAAIALAESSGCANAINNTKNEDKTWDIGLWQVSTLHQGAFGLPSIAGGACAATCDCEFVKHLQDANNNAIAAVQIKKCQGWNAWTVYNNGTYLACIPNK